MNTLENPDLDTPGTWRDFLDYLQSQNLTQEEFEVKLTQFYLRYEDRIVEDVDDTLGSGSIRDYVKALHRILVQSKQPEDVANGSAAVKKYREAMVQFGRDSTTKSTEGDADGR